MGFWGLLVESYQTWKRDPTGRLSASLAYYALISIAPLLVIGVAIAGLVFGQQAVEGQVRKQVQDLVGPAGAQVVQILVRQAYQPRTGIMASAFSFAVLLLGAAGVFSELRDALNMIWGVPERPWRGVRQFFRERVLPYAMVVGIGVLLLVSFLLTAVMSALTAYIRTQLRVTPLVLHLANFVVSFAVVMLLFAMIYRALPDVHIPWSDVWTGAAVTALLFTIGKTLIGFYLGQTGVGSAYGAAGSFVIFLVWIYYSAQIFYLGAEFTRIYSRWHGPRAADRHRAA